MHTLTLLFTKRINKERKMQRAKFTHLPREERGQARGITPAGRGWDFELSLDYKGWVGVAVVWPLGCEACCHTARSISCSLLQCYLLPAAVGSG